MKMHTLLYSSSDAKKIPKYLLSSSDEKAYSSVFFIRWTHSSDAKEIPKYYYLHLMKMHTLSYSSSDGRNTKVSIIFIR
jgi:uncharacterized protein Veg